MFRVYLKQAAKFFGAWIGLVWCAMALASLDNHGHEYAALSMGGLGICLLFFMAYTIRRTFSNREAYIDQTVREMAKRDFHRRGYR